MKRERGGAVKRERGGALVMVVVMTLVVSVLTSVAMHTAHMQMLATNAYAVNANGRRLAENGVHDGAAYLNEILSAKRCAASESAYERIVSMDADGADIWRLDNGAVCSRVPDTDIPIDLTQDLLYARGRSNILFKTLFKKYMDAEICKFLEIHTGAGNAFGYAYTMIINDIHASEYEVTVNIGYSGGGFTITATAMNARTGVTNTAAGLAAFIYEDGAETLSDNGTLTIENAGGFRYALSAVKKAFE